MSEEEQSNSRRVMERVLYTRLLREAAGVSASDWIFSDAEVRGEIHDRGERALVAAADWDYTEWEALPAESKARSDVLLAGAAKLNLVTSWEGWPA